MPKWYDEDDDDRHRGHRPRSRQRKRWDDAEPTQVYVPPPRSERPAPSMLPRLVAAATSTGGLVETGTVRFFEPTKGFGFIAPAGGAPGSDLFVHITAVRRAGMETLASGQTIRFERGPGRHPGKEAVVRILPD